MKTSVIYYLEQTAYRFPEKMAYKDKDEEISFGSLVSIGKRIGTKISEILASRKPSI